MSTAATTFAALAATLYAAHQIADHVLGQTDTQAALKATRSRRGWAALARHVTAYHTVMAVMVTIAWAMLDLDLSAVGLAAGLTVSVATHTVWDRRTPVRWVLEHTGARKFAAMADRGLNGMYLADQALHLACLWAAGLLAVTL